MNILILMPESHRRSIFSPQAWEELHELGDVVVAASADDHADPSVRAALGVAEVVVTGTGTALLTEADLDAAPRLRLLVHAAGSLRPVIGEYGYERGLVLAAHAGENAVPVAEYTVAMMLLELKGVRRAEQLYRRRRGAIDVDGLLEQAGNHRRRIGIVSASRIGRRVIELLRCTDHTIQLYDPLLQPAEASALGAIPVDLDALMATSDLVSIHAPLLPATHHLIDRRRLGLLKDGAILVNTARGAIVDQQALVDELVSGRIRAVVDVTEPEVPEPESPLWDLENLVLTPHVAGSRGLELRRIGEAVVGDIAAHRAGVPLASAVPRERYAANA